MIFELRYERLRVIVSKMKMKTVALTTTAGSSPCS